MNDHPENLNPSVQYERSDLSLRAVLIFSGVLVVVLGIVSLGLWFLIPATLGPTRAPEAVAAWKFRGEPGPNPDDSHLPAKPELEFIDRNARAASASTRNIQEQIAEEEKHLSSYGKVDKNTAFIPIDEAMKRLAGRAP